MAVVKSLGRGLDVLFTVANAPAPLTASEVAEWLGRSRVQVSRTLHSLEAAAILERNPDRTYRLSWRMFGLSAQVCHARVLTDGADILADTVRLTGESAFLSERRGDGAVAILEKLVSGISWVGRSFPLYCDDAGQILLLDCSKPEVELIFARTEFVSYSPTTPTSVDDFWARLLVARTAGFSIVDGESQPDVFAVAAPVRNFSGQIVCALHIQGPSPRLLGRADELGTTIKGLADRLSERLGWPGLPSATPIPSAPNP